MSIRLTVKAQRQNARVRDKKNLHASYANPPNSQGTMSKRASEKKTQNEKCSTLPMPIRLTVKAHRQNARLRQKKIFHAAYANPPNSQGTTSKRAGAKKKKVARCLCQSA